MTYFCVALSNDVAFVFLILMLDFLFRAGTHSCARRNWKCKTNIEGTSRSEKCSNFSSTQTQWRWVLSHISRTLTSIAFIMGDCCRLEVSCGITFFRNLMWIGEFAFFSRCSIAAFMPLYVTNHTQLSLSMFGFKKELLSQAIIVEDPKNACLSVGSNYLVY